MPTGYTAALYEGEQPFEDFVLGCAHAFFYDSDLRSALPEKIEPSPFYRNRLKEVTERLNELRSMSDAEATTRAAADRVEWERARDEARASAQARLARYSAMLAQVEAWTPPTEEHIALRDFMVEQLRDSIKGDGGINWGEGPSTDGPTWRGHEISKAIEEASWSLRRANEDDERAAKWTVWLRHLREGLGMGVGA